MLTPSTVPTDPCTVPSLDAVQAEAAARNALARARDEAAQIARLARLAVRQRKTLAVLARTVGGARTGELHALRWEAFGPGFETVYLPRGKTNDAPDHLGIREDHRPFLHAWWSEWGRPTSGAVFPLLTGDGAGTDAKGARNSYAQGLRRDLQRAFEWATKEGIEAPTKGSDRWRELFATDHPTSKRVDFHSFRRGFVSGLVRGGISEQQSMAMANHRTSTVHRGYARTAMGGAG